MGLFGGLSEVELKLKAFEKAAEMAAGKEFDEVIVLAKKIYAFLKEDLEEVQTDLAGKPPVQDQAGTSAELLAGAEGSTAEVATA